MGLSGNELFQEQMRIINAVRNPDADRDLLDVLLDGEEKNVKNVLGLRAFVAKFDDLPMSPCQIRTTVLSVCDDFLKANGTTPPAEVKRAGCVLDEFEVKE